MDRLVAWKGSLLVGDRLDDVARAMAAREDTGLPRRKALRSLAGLFGGGVVAVFARQAPAGAAPPLKCPSGFVACDGMCRDTAINPDHCGGCGNACPPGQQCRNGVCVPCLCEPGCAAGQTRCNGVCVDTQTDPGNCGTCGTVCASGNCVAGSCQPCPSGQTLCDGMCVDTTSSESHCGSCGNPCTAPSGGTAICINGACLSECPPNMEVCGTTCVSVGQSCQTGLPGICAAGTVQCVDGNAVCVQSEQPRQEICNGLDDDCDGVVDGGDPGGGQPCDTGRPWPCNQGTTECRNGQLICVAPC